MLIATNYYSDDDKENEIGRVRIKHGKFEKCV
jgi:hypothetical protein